MKKQTNHRTRTSTHSAGQLQQLDDKALMQVLGGGGPVPDICPHHKCTAP